MLKPMVGNRIENLFPTITCKCLVVKGIMGVVHFNKKVFNLIKGL